MANSDNKIDGNDYAVRELLGRKYSIDYYQREYRWERKHVEALLLDLEARFSASYTVGDSWEKVAEYPGYFLGPIVVSHKDGKRFLIDGQQRLTTLTLLLIHLHQVQENRDELKEEYVALDHLIYSQSKGKKSFHIDVEERQDCMLALFEGRPFAPPDDAGSVANLVDRFTDISELFPDELATPETLPYFIEWLLDNVILVEISTYNDEDAYAIFETMNDRGLSLTPAEMLKAYLLSKLDQDTIRAAADEHWRSQIARLSELGKDEDADFFKAWLRAQYAEAIREGKPGASNQDFELIGSGFHRWVRDNAVSKMGLQSPNDFRAFVETRVPHGLRAYELLREAENAPTPGLEYVYYNRISGFPLQPPLLLAAIADTDDTETIREKFRLVAGYIDIFIFRRVVNFKSRSGRALAYTMFTTMKEIRRASVDQVAELMRTKAMELDEVTGIDGILSFNMHQTNKPQVRNLLARLTAHVQEAVDGDGSFADYVARQKNDPYEIEHIIADKPDRLIPSVFDNQPEFDSARNQLGGLLLLPKSFNASFGADTYEEKLPHYGAQNVLARSLSETCYLKNPKFVVYKDEHDLPFQPFEHFGKDELASRQGLYRDIAAQIWSLDRFDRQA